MNQNIIDNQSNEDSFNNQIRFDSQDDQINNDLNESFMGNMSSDDIYTILSDFFPSFIFSSLLISSLILTNEFCDSNFLFIVKFMLGLYISYIIKSIYQFLYLLLSDNPKGITNLILNSISVALYILHFIGCIFTFIVFNNKNQECFYLNTYLTSILFSIFSIGFIGMSKYILYALLFIIIFPTLIDYYLSNAGKFHYTFGFSKEVLSKLPTTFAEDFHVNDCCTICMEHIEFQQEIMILRCDGRHFYHVKCIREWLMHKFCCPICKSYKII